MSDLLPCPWCKGIDIRAYGDAPQHGDHAWSARCYGCGAFGPWAETEAEALAAWNRRAPSATYPGDGPEASSQDDDASHQSDGVDSPLPSGWKAHAAAYRAGAEAMREAAAETAEKAVWCPCGGPPCQTPAGHGCGVSPAEGVEVAAAIRALPLPEAASGWRPIETVPRDGTRVFCYAFGTSDRAAVWRVDYWWLEQRAFAHMRPYQPYTHWQPLPEAPEEPK